MPSSLPDAAKWTELDLRSLLLSTLVHGDEVGNGVREDWVGKGDAIGQTASACTGALCPFRVFTWTGAYQSQPQLEPQTKQKLIKTKALFIVHSTQIKLHLLLVEEVNAYGAVKGATQQKLAARNEGVTKTPNSERDEMGIYVNDRVKINR